MKDEFGLWNAEVGLWSLKLAMLVDSISLNPEKNEVVSTSTHGAARVHRQVTDGLFGQLPGKNGNVSVSMRG